MAASMGRWLCRCGRMIGGQGCNSMMAMISISVFVVFLVASGIVFAYVGLVHKFLSKAE